MSEVFYISASVRQNIIEQAEFGFPNEICGFVGGTLKGTGIYVKPAKNISGHPRNAYNISPEEILGALVEFESAGNKLTAIYHSHPNYPALPSNIDLSLADMPDVCYLIVGVQKGNQHFNADLRAYQILEKNGRRIAFEVKLELMN